MADYKSEREKRLTRPGRKQIEQERSPSKSLPKMILGMGLMMLGYGVAIKASKGISHLVNRKVGKQAFKWSLNERSGLHKFVNSVMRRSKRYVAKGYSKDRAAAITRKLEQTKGAYTKLRDDTARSINTLKQSYSQGTYGFSDMRYWSGKANKMMDDYGFTAMRKVKGMNPKSLTHLSTRDIRGTSIFLNINKVKSKPLFKKINAIRTSKSLEKHGDLFARAAGKQYQSGGKNFSEAMKSRMYRYGVNAASGFALEYPMWRMTMHEKDNKWSSGEAIGSYMAFRTLGDVAFGGALSLGASKALNAVKHKVVLPRKSKPFIDKMLGGLDKISRSSVVVSLHESMKDVRFSDKPTSVKHIPKMLTKLGKRFSQYQNKYSKVRPMDRPTAANSAVADSIKFIKEMDLKKADDSKSAILKILTAHKNVYTHLKSEDPNTALSKISWMFKKMDDAPIGSKSRDIRNTIKQHSYRREPGKDAITDVLIRKAKGGKDEFPEYFIPRSGVVDFGGKQYDLSNLMPSNVTKSASNILGSISIFGIKPAKLFGMPQYTSVEDQFYTRKYTSGTRTYVGPLRDGIEDGSLIESLGKDLRKPTDYSVNVKDNLYNWKLFDRGTDDVLLAVHRMKQVRMGTTVDDALMKSGTKEQQIKKFSQQIKTGHIDLIGDEEVWYVGKNLYYTPDTTAKTPEIFQMGIDWKKNKYHSFDVLTRENAGGLGVISDSYHGIDGLGLANKPRKRTRIREDDGFFMRQFHKFQDFLDFGSYERPSVFNVVGDLFRRFQGASKPRLYFSKEGAFNPDLINSIGKDKILKNAFVTTTQQHVSKMKRSVVDTLFKRKEFITAARGRMRKAGIADVDPDDVFAMLDKNKNKTYDDMVDYIKKDARDLFGIKSVNPQQAPVTRRSSAAKFLSDDEIDFVNSVFKDRDPTRTVAKLTFGNMSKDKYSMLKKYDNVRIKTFLGQMRDDDINAIVGEMQSKTFMASLKKQENALDLVRIFNSDMDGPTLTELMNNQDVAKVSNSLLGKYNNILKSNEDVFMEYAKQSDPIWKLRGSPHVRSNFNNNLGTGDVFISRNMTSEGEGISSFFESIMPKTYKDMYGNVFPEGPLTKGSMMSLGTINAINNTAAFVGLGFSSEHMRTPLTFMKNTITKRVLPAVALGAAWNISDTVTDEIPLFDGTSLGQGINSFAAEQVGKARLTIGRVNDIMGITDSAKYLENLLPGSIESPLAGAVRGFGFPIMGSALGVAKAGPSGGMLGGAIGLGLSVLTAGGPLAFAGCLPYDEEITTESGFKKIGEIKEGDYVFTKEGRTKKVISTKKSLNTHIYRVNVCGVPLSFSATGNHWIYVWNGKEPKWKLLSNVKKNDYIAFPSKRRKQIGTLNYVKYMETDKWPILVQGRKPCERTIQLLSTSKFNERKGVYQINNITPNWNGYSWPNYKIGMLFGWFISEGSIMARKNGVPYGISLACSFNEAEHIKNIVNECKEYFPISSINVRREIRKKTKNSPIYGNNGCTVKVFSPVLGRICSGLFYTGEKHNSHNKWIHPDLTSVKSDAFLWSIIGAIIDGDGCVHTSHNNIINSITITTVSKHLSWVIWKTLNELGVQSIVHRYRQKTNVNTKPGKSCLSYNVQIASKDNICKVHDNCKDFSYKLAAKTIPKYEEKSMSRSSSYYFTKDGYSYYRIKDITIEEYDKPVFDIEVEDDSSFVGFGITYHNSFDLTKHRAEVIEEYSGRKQVPVNRGEGWLLSSNPLHGMGVDYYKQSWFHLTRSDFKETDALYGSKTERLLNTFNPNHYMEKHKYTRPYPFSSGIGNNIPLIGGVIGMGGEVQDYPEIKYTMENASANLNYEPSMETMGLYSNMETSPSIASRPNSAFIADTPGNVMGEGVQPMKPTAFPARFQSAFYGASEFMGLRGFVSQSMLTGLNDGMFPYETTPIMQSANLMTSPVRSWWDTIPNDPIGCFVAGTKIETNKGVKPIEDVKVDDKVLSDGVMRRVVNIVKYNNKKVRRLKINNIGQEIIGTEQHKIPIYRRIQCVDNHKRPCRPGAKLYCSVCSLRNNEITTTDIPLCDVKPNDYVVVPIIKTDNNYGKIIDLTKYVNHNHTDKYIYMTKHRIYAYSYEVLEEYGTEYPTKNVKERIREKYGDIEIKHVYINDARRKARNGKILHRWSRYIEIDEDMLYLMGWWVAEGSKHSNKYGLTWTLNSSEINIAKKIQRIIKSKFNDSSYIKHCNGNAIVLCTSSYGISKVMPQLFGRGAHNKHIPYWVKSLPLHLLRHFLEGIIKGDGWISDGDKLSGFTSASRQLTEDVFQTAIRFGLGGSVVLDYKEHNKSRKSPSGGDYLLPEYSTRSYIQWHKEETYKMKRLFEDGVITDGSKEYIIKDHWHICGGFLYVKVASNEEKYIADTVYDITIENKHYYTANLVMVHNTMEFTRRMVPKRGEHINEFNPLINAQPQWLPGQGDDSFQDFQTGDAFTKIRLGEARLPGSGFEATHDVKYSAPLEAEYVGMRPTDALNELLGTKMPIDKDKRYDKIMSGRMSKQIADTLSGYSTDIKMETPVFNPMLNLSGKFNMTIGKEHGINVKTVSSDTFDRIGEPRSEDSGEMNALLNLSKNINYGSIIYVDAESGRTKEYQVMSDPLKFQRDIRKTMMVKDEALSMVADHGPKISKGLGNVYSRVDRLAVLGDTAPWSDEYNKTLSEVQSMDKLGLLSPDDQRKMYLTVQRREKKRNRFKYTERKFTRGTAITAEEEMKQSAIRREYSGVERLAGKAWETATFQDTLLTSRFINNVTPADAYRKYFTYGEGPIKNWEEPYRDFIRPYMNSALNRTDPITSSISMGTAGWVFGGPLGAGLGAAAGAGWGAIHGKEEVPGYTEDRSELLKQIDSMTYMKAQQSASTGDIGAFDTMRKTMKYSFNESSSVQQMIPTLPKTEREFVREFVKSGTAEERERIMNLVPDYAQYILNQAWDQGQDGYDVENPIADVAMPDNTWAGYDPSIQSKDIAVKMLDRSGYEARSQGLGFQSQRRKMLRKPNIPSTFDTKMKVTIPDLGKLKSIVKSSLPGAEVTVMPSQIPGVKVRVTGEYTNYGI